MFAIGYLRCINRYLKMASKHTVLAEDVASSGIEVEQPHVPLPFQFLIQFYTPLSQFPTKVLSSSKNNFLKLRPHLKITSALPIQCTGTKINKFVMTFFLLSCTSVDYHHVWLLEFTHFFFVK